MSDKSERERRHADHFLEWLKAYWFLIGAGIAVVSILFKLWADLEFMRGAVNPETLAVYQQEQSARTCDARVHRLYDDMRWCVTSAATPKLRWKCLDK